MQIYSKRAAASPYWNEYMETMPREKLDQLHLRRIQRLVKYAYEKIPTIDKPDVVRYQGDNPPFGGSIVKDSDEYISFYFQTSGTTGAPLKEVGYYRDMMSTGWVFKWWAHGIRPNDIFYVAFPFCTFIAFFCAYYD